MLLRLRCFNLTWNLLCWTHDLLPSRHPTCPRTAQAPARPRPAGEEIDRRGGRRRGYQRRRHRDCRPSPPVSDTLKPHATSEQRAPTASSNLRQARRMLSVFYHITVVIIISLSSVIQALCRDRNYKTSSNLVDPNDLPCFSS